MTQDLGLTLLVDKSQRLNTPTYRNVDLHISNVRQWAFILCDMAEGCNVPTGSKQLPCEGADCTGRIEAADGWRVPA